MSDEIKYLDFEVTVQKTGENEYIVRAESGEGEAEGRFVSPFNEDKRALISATLTKIALRSSAKTRSSSAPEVKKMKEVGTVLFENVINGPVREFFNRCQGLADQDGKGIRWRLSLDPSVGDLPWEFMYLQDEFLALNPRSPIVRYIKGAARVAPLKGEHPLRLLVVIASPSDEVPLDTTAEKERIAAALQPLTSEGRVDVTYIEGPNTWERLIEVLLPNRTHILHFIGHGAFDEDNKEGVLVMEDADGKAVRIDSERLRVLVQGKSRLRLVVLNSCLGTEGDDIQPFSSMAAGLVRSGIPAVIAMQFEISDKAAGEIAHTFYKSLAFNLPVDAALTEARRAIFLSDRNSLEWATPILYMQVPDGQLFQFKLDKRASSKTAARTADVDTGPLPEPSPTMEAIAILVQSETGAETPLSNNSIRIGRGPDNDIALSEALASRKHATLTCKGSTYVIQNFGRSGTLVNGKPITKPQKLKDNDVIRLGGDEFKFRLLAAVAAEAVNSVRARAVTAEPKPAPPVQRQPQPPAQYSPTQPPPQPQPDSGFESRLYEIADSDPKLLAEGIRQYFFTQGHESQIVQQNNVWVVQGQKTGWRSWVGMGQAATVMIEPAGNNLKISVGGGKWLEQGAAIAVSMLVLWPLIITGGVGMAQQKALMDNLWRMAENFVATNGGRRVG